MTEHAIVTGGADDLAAIMPIMADAFDPQFGEAWTAPQCLGVLAMPGSQLFVARGAAPCGFALARTIAEECELMLLAVSRQSQRQGLGRALLATTIDHARMMKASTVFLEVRDGNSAISLYSSAGFEIVGRRSRYYRGLNGDLFDALTLRCELN